MSIEKYITPGRCVILQSKDKNKALGKLAERIKRDLPELEEEKILEAVLDREHAVTTRIASGLAMPHARIPGIQKTVAAVGISVKGIEYDLSEESRVHVLIMIVGGDSDHLQALSTMADAFSREGLIDQLRKCHSGRSVYRILTGRHGAAGTGRLITKLSMSVLKQALTFAHAVKAETLFVYTETPIENDPAVIKMFNKRLVRVCSEAVTPDVGLRIQTRSVLFLEFPFPGVASHSRVNLALLLALAKGYITQKEKVVNVLSCDDTEELSAIILTDVHRNFRFFFSAPGNHDLSDLNQSVLIRMLQVVTELAQEGREGKPVGALFVIGDEDTVKKHSQQMVINPFRGYDERERNIMDPGLTETIKEFAHIDGAIIVRDDGVIITAGAYLRADQVVKDFPPGLGARHAAAASISAVSDALSIALSQSTGQISLFRSGKRIMVL